MAYEDKTRAAATPHGLTLEERSKLTVSGVEDVESFDEERIVMKTVKGGLVVTGHGLKIGRLSLDAGELLVEGSIDDLSYTAPAAEGGFWARLFG